MLLRRSSCGFVLSGISNLGVLRPLVSVQGTSRSQLFRDARSLFNLLTPEGGRRATTIFPSARGAPDETQNGTL